MPNETDSRSVVCERTTKAMQRRCPGIIAAPSLIMARTGVTAGVPMMCELVMSAPTQWVREMKPSWATPGMKYLLPPDMPTTSWGRTGPMTIFTSASTTRRLMSTSQPVDRRPSLSSAMRAPPMRPTRTSIEGSRHSWLTIVIRG